MVKGCFAGTDWNQNEFEKYVEQSKMKLSLNRNRKSKPGNIELGLNLLQLPTLSMFSWNGSAKLHSGRGVVGLVE